MTLRIEIVMKSEPFKENPDAEVISILSRIIELISQGSPLSRPGDYHLIEDSNHNFVGQAKVTR